MWRVPKNDSSGEGARVVIRFVTRASNVSNTLRLSSQPELFLGLLSAITTFVNSLCRSSAVDIRQAIP